MWSSWFILIGKRVCKFGMKKISFFEWDVLNRLLHHDFFLSICQLSCILHVHFLKSVYLLMLLFSLMLDDVWFLPTYCRLHIVHSMRYMTYSVLQFFIIKYLSSVIGLLAFEWCYSFHFFATCICNMWPT